MIHKMIVLKKPRPLRYILFGLFLSGCFLLSLVAQQDRYLSAVLSRMFLSAAMAVGLDICTGIAGQLSLGQASFMAAGAYVCAFTTVHLTSPAAPLIGLLAGIAAAGLMAVLTGIPVLRLKGDYLAVATLGLGEITRIFLENFTPFGGAAGMFHIPLFSNAPSCFLTMAVALAFAFCFVRSKAGLYCKAISCDEKAAGAAGVSTFGLKLIAFVAAACVCAMAGGMYSGLAGFIGPRDFAFTRSTDILAAVVLGGPGSIIGPAIAAMALELTSALLQPVAELRMILYAVLLIVAAILRYRKKGAVRA
jgi:branched-chain amino acid transport system permease protein